MTATLTPERTEEATDLLEEQFRDSLTCHKCTADPTVLHIRKCCGNRRPFCPTHHKERIGWMESMCDGEASQCGLCGTVWHLVSIDQALKVVDL